MLWKRLIWGLGASAWVGLAAADDNALYSNDTIATYSIGASNCKPTATVTATSWRTTTSVQTVMMTTTKDQ